MAANGTRTGWSKRARADRHAAKSKRAVVTHGPSSLLAPSSYLLAPNSYLSVPVTQPRLM